MRKRYYEENLRMTHGIESIVYQKKEIACVYRASISVSGLQFLTNQDNAFQIGIQVRPKGTRIPAHMHNIPKPIVIKQIQEFLYVVIGSIRVTLLNDKLKVISVKILDTGDSILLKSQGHRVEFLKDARVIELKQGPYPGKVHAKKYLEHV